MVQYTATVAESIRVNQADTFSWYATSLSETFRVIDLPIVGRPVSIAEGVGVEPTAPTYAFRPGATVNEAVGMDELFSLTVKYDVTVAQGVGTNDYPYNGFNVLLTAGIGIDPALSLVQAVRLAERLGIYQDLLPSTTYATVISQGFRIGDALSRFLGYTFADQINIHAAQPTYQYRPDGPITENIGIAGALTERLIFRITTAEEFQIEDLDILNGIYTGSISEGIEITAGYVSPDGSFTTWAVNTRTGAVTEYTNSAFNSFAPMGVKYLAADDTGLYELTGDDDDGSDIIAQIKSGLFQFGGAHFNSFAAAYLGLRGAGQYVLKLETGDGRTYTYQLDVNDMFTTKVQLGKGLRARYFSFELISSGSDFDLESVEFIPIVASRRV